jgi:integrase
MTSIRRIQFNQDTLRALPIPSREESRIEYRDKACPGLVLRVTANGRKTFNFYAWCKARGAPYRETLGSFPALPIKAAQDKAKILSAKIAQGEDPSESRRKKRERKTFGQLFEGYIEQSARPRKLRTVDEMLRNYRRHLQKPLGTRLASSITKAEMAELHAHLTQTAGSTTANRHHALVHAVFNWALDLDLVESNPATAVRRNPEHSRERYVTEPEMPYFLDAAKDEPNSDVGEFFQMCLFTGARGGEIKSIRWDQVHFGDKPVLSLPRTKNGRARDVVLIPQAMQIIDRRFARRSSSPFVFPGVGRRGHLVEPRKGWERVRARAEVYRLLDALAHRGALEAAQGATYRRMATDKPEAARDALRAIAEASCQPWQALRMDDLRIHDLRRTMGSWLANRHASQWVIGKVLGHLSPQSTSIYARPGLDAARNSVSAVVESMVSLARPTVACSVANHSNESTINTTVESG